MTSPPRSSSPLTPPGLSSIFFSFTRAFTRPNDPPPRKSFAPSLDFDAGINTSTAWTVHLDSDRDSVASPSPTPNPSSLSDDEADETAFAGDGRGARVLHAFAGKPEFREIVVEAGDEINVVREDAGDGWSLVRNNRGQMGLLPRTYYTFTVDFLSSPIEASHTQHASTSRRDASTQSLTPRNTVYQVPFEADPDVQPIVMQTTGERMLAAFPSFRQSLLGGKSLNRFSSFVTSGAEAYVLKGAGIVETSPSTTIRTPTHGPEPSEDADDNSDDSDGEASGNPKPKRTSEADRHFVDAGPSWRPKVPPFRILVHSPSKRTSTLSGSYTVYSVTSLFHFPSEGADSEVSATRITVHRRFSHFVVLHTALTRRLPGIALPPLPEKQYAGRFNDDFVEARRGDLERYLAKVVRHPVARYAEILTFFLGCESDVEWKRQLPRHLRLPAAGPSFYANVFHPEFNLDAEEAAEAVDRFDEHTRAVGTGVQDLRDTFGQYRQARVEMSKAERMLSYAFLSLVTAKPLASVSEEEQIFRNPDVSDEETRNSNPRRGKGRMNEDGAWCWREDCKECLRLTKALVKTSETMQNVADLYDDHARRTQLHTHDALKSAAHPSPLYAAVVDTHRNALSRYTEAMHPGKSTTDEVVGSRCETVLNTTMAEMEAYHTQKVEDFSALAKEHLDGEIEFYEQILTRLRTARRTFEPPVYPALSTGARQPSIYERELAHPRTEADPLPQPCPHVFDSAPMRPVSHAIQEGVNMLLGSGTGGRASVFGRFW
ncbi:hypothetical protein OF83DRAFT_1048316 [Amylostereum chailletii]|nr:hypothetical protein OF83DRAFT_1048316 [Amylostereum chailletii]